MPQLFESAFYFVDTHGLPLDAVMARCHYQGVPVDLSAFLSDALKAGWSREKTVAKCNEAVNLLRGVHCHFLLEKSPKCKAAPGF